MLVPCEVLESILKRKIKNIKENTKCLYLCQISPNLGNHILYYDRYEGAASYLSPVRASRVGIHLRCFCRQCRKQENILTQLPSMTLLGFQGCSGTRYTTGVLQWIHIGFSRKKGWGSKGEPTVKMLCWPCQGQGRCGWGCEGGQPVCLWKLTLSGIKS